MKDKCKGLNFFHGCKKQIYSHGFCRPCYYKNKKKINVPRKRTILNAEGFASEIKQLIQRVDILNLPPSERLWVCKIIDLAKAELR